ncbi:monovalent cation/H+ antiporter subunit A [Agrobacterium rubi]|uniref:monovalent cation/H+ antiporter subunit A n=1 Tax=Agrobacterium rubi TaxID=28099 RepID=UPI0015724280|nr:monovalent cation/H+ antiporter subunit A [Agrobacterium rubi]NTF06425.1 monovalent cation/H+ antiporter subunit A [Agrobacterium rubi]NTF18667.1 monovalent cation/H+ antiporter subunit A [Agrobacterium rubi]NTF25630.1 monovalent cation/H+ antiporter subunit A [Agrobacterium rubi]
MSLNVLLPILIALPFIGSIITAMMPRDGAARAPVAVAAGISLFSLVTTILLYSSVKGGAVLKYDVEWLPQLGLNFTLRLDGFAWMFAVLITGIGLLVVLYARYYMSAEDPIPRFFAFFLSFMGSMLGIVLSGNVILLSIFWEMTSIFSFLLIGYWHHNATARDGARMALTVTGIGGFCLLAGLLILGHMAGSYDLDAIIAKGADIRAHSLYVPALVLILIGALTKSAQFPFHFWLPNAMAAPTPVSAYLHSATMVKAGVFLLVRLWPVLAGTQEWFWLVGFAGISTLLLGAYFAMFQQDLKGLLAYSTISHLGLITTLLSLGSPLAAVAAIFHMMNHATFKASLFMAAGIIDHETGTRDMRRLSGLYRFLPATATLAMAASAAMAGVPLFNGFLSKEMFFAESVETHADSLLDKLLPYVATLSGAFAVAYSLRFIHTVFFGPPPHDIPNPKPHEPPRWMRFPIEFLVLACLIVGVVPSLSIGPFLHSAVLSVLGPQTPAYSLSIWHGFNLPLIMSLVALVGGVAIYALLGGYFARCEDGPPFFRHLRGQRIFERVMVTVSWKWARWAESTLGTRRLQPQLRMLILVALIAGFSPLASSNFSLTLPSVTTFDPIFAILWAIGMIAAMGAAWQAKYHRLAALVMLGVSGLVTCLTFVWLSAPDLAITQLLVEIVTLVLILLGLRWLPKRMVKVDNNNELPSQLRRGRDFLLAVFCGIGMSVIAFAVMTLPVPNTIANFFLERAYSEGGGTNVVNVILVDFRGFDTMGEIAVLAIVGLTVFSLLRRFRPAQESIGLPEQQLIQNAFDADSPERSKGDTVRDYLLVPSVIMQWMFPVIVTFSIYLFMRGHDLPGGGFSAGITMAVAFLLQYLAGGTRWAEDRIRILPLRWMGFGLLMSAATGMGSWFFGYPFLTSYFQYTEIPYIGKMPTATALLFDLGVFALVVGATVLILIALAHQSLRNYKIRVPDVSKAEEA